MKTGLDRLIKNLRVQAVAGVVAERVLMGLTAGTCLALIAYFTIRGNTEAAKGVQNFKDRYFGSSASSPYVSGDAVFSPAAEAEIGAMTPTEIDAIAKDFSQGKSFTDVGVGANPFANEYGVDVAQSFGGYAEPVSVGEAENQAGALSDWADQYIGDDFQPPDCDKMRILLEQMKAMLTLMRVKFGFTWLDVHAYAAGHASTSFGRLAIKVQELQKYINEQCDDGYGDFSRNTMERAMDEM